MGANAVSHSGGGPRRQNLVAPRLGLAAPLLRGLAIVLALSWAADAAAADVPLAGKRLVMVEKRNRQRLQVRLRDTVPAPTTGGSDDPALVGATVAVVNPKTREGTTFDLPALHWGMSRNGRRFRYRARRRSGDPSAMKVAVIRSGRLIKLKAREVGVTLDEPTQGSIGITITMGTTRYCALFGGTIRKDRPGRFVAKNAPAPAACPPTPVPTTTTLPGATTSTTIVPATTSTTLVGATTSTTLVGATTSTTLVGATTSTSVVGTTTTTSSTTPGTAPSAPCCNGAPFLHLTTADAPGDCGDVVDLFGNLVGQLACSGLYFGGGLNSVPLPATLPDQGVSVLFLSSCTGQTATLAATTPGQTGTVRTCSDAGCLFGAPLAIPNTNSTPTSSCVINTVAAPAAGMLDCLTGGAAIDLPLTSEVFLTGDLDPAAGIQPCARCLAGTCVGGPNDGQACAPETTVLGAAYPTSHDCPPPASLSLGGLPIGFALSTDAVSWTATPAINDTETEVNQARVFAGFCRDANFTGAFASPAEPCWENGVAVGPPCTEPFETCAQRNQGAFGPMGGGVKTLTAIGTALVGLLEGPAAGTLASVFAIPPTYDPTVDAAGDLPGPGAATIPGIGELCATINPCVPPVVPTTTTVPGGVTTTSTTLASTTSTIALTTTSTSTTTTSTLFPGCAPPGVPAGAVSFVTEPGSPDCGGPGLDPAPQAPFSGAVLDGADVVLADLGEGCLYVGGGLANALPPPAAPDGAEARLNVGTVSGSALTLAASDGTGILDCTRRAGPASHCMNGAVGTDGNGLCTMDADCGGGTGNCLPDANCFFGPPIPLSPASPALATCLVNAFVTDVCGALDLAGLTSSLQFALSTRLYLTQDPVTPCPQCTAGTCTAGARVGLACSQGIGSNATSNECPPLASQYVGELFVNPIEVSTGASDLVADVDGNFCPGQRSPGALGTGLTARTIQQTGTMGGGGDTFAARFAGNVCAPSSGNALVDSVEDLPGPVSLSFSGTLGVCLLPDVCNTLCNPCTLGPLCGVVCAPCGACS